MLIKKIRDHNYLNGFKFVITEFALFIFVILPYTLHSRQQCAYDSMVKPKSNSGFHLNFNNILLTWFWQRLIIAHKSCRLLLIHGSLGATIFKNR